MAGIRIRKSVIGDIPRIVELIRQSFLALSDHYGDESHVFAWEDGVSQAMKEDLNDEAFERAYFKAPGSCFWVAEDEDNQVVGCVGLKRFSGDEAELVRMAVDNQTRSKGTGTLLVKSLLSHCKQHRICRVFLHTANPLANKFYVKCGFTVAQSFKHTIVIPGVVPVEMNVFKSVYYVGAKIVRKVGLVGGTHGNELLGIELVKKWQLDQKNQDGPDELRRKTLSCLPVLSNLPAIAVNRRYVDKDLNRQFKRETLDAILSRTSTTSQGLEMEDYSATRLNALLGPKNEFYTVSTVVDFIIDMHSSTSNLGNMLILGCLTHDNLAAHTAYQLKQRLCGDGNNTECMLGNGVLRVASTDISKEVSHWVDSIAPSGLAIEVGQLAHGTTNATLLEDTRRIVLTALDYLDERNLSILEEARQTAATVSSRSRSGDAGVDVDLLVDSQSFDFDTATYVPCSLAPASMIPSVLAGKAVGSVELDYFFMVHALTFPNPSLEAAATTSAAATSAAATPTTTTMAGPGEAAEERTFASLPAAVAAQLKGSIDTVRSIPAKDAILHASMDNKDWSALSEGAPLFQSLKGNRAVVPFNRAEHCPPEKDSSSNLYPVFINEAAYQGNNTACWIVKDAKFTLH